MITIICFFIVFSAIVGVVSSIFAYDDAERRVGIISRVICFILSAWLGLSCSLVEQDVEYEIKNITFVDDVACIQINGVLVNLNATTRYNFLPHDFIVIQYRSDAWCLGVYHNEKTSVLHPNDLSPDDPFYIKHIQKKVKAPC